MTNHLPEIDRLIEQGLTLYGQGDLDGALLVWEQVLAIDPANSQANSYVDYVRMNYDLLSADEVGDGAVAPFGIADDDAEYQIEILPGEVEPALPKVAPMYMDPLDEGWIIEKESAHVPGVAESPPETATLDLEANQPADPPAQQPAASGTFDASRASVEPPATFESTTDGGLSFDAATREYQGTGKPLPNSEPLRDFASTPEPVTSEFRSEATPGFGSPSDYQTPHGGFGSLPTDVKKRELGFVQPRLEEPAREHRPSAPPELKMTLRTPARGAPESPTVERSPDTADLLGSLPSPRAAPHEPSGDEAAQRRAARTSTPPYGARGPTPDPHQPLEPPAVGLDDLAPAFPSATRDLPSQTRPPAHGTAPTRGLEQEEAPSRPSASDFSQQLTPAVERPDAQPRPITRDFEVVTKRRPGAPGDLSEAIAGREHHEQATHDLRAAVPPGPSLISAPTRDLGLRRAATEDEPTSQATITSLRKPEPERPRGDALGFDPIDAQSASILEDIDIGAPASEQSEDRTRRRITTLFEKAARWSGAGDLEKAVAAVDLALSEDPNSALAQKLIHRNRETIMAVFQAFLGDLERQPQLARPLHELATAPISPRAAFLLSRVDGQLSLDEILDVSGMPRLEAYRYLCQLYLRGILR